MRDRLTTIVLTAATLRKMGLGAAADAYERVLAGGTVQSQTDCGGRGGWGDRPLSYRWTAPDGREQMGMLPSEVASGFERYCGCAYGQAARAAHQQAVADYVTGEQQAWHERFWKRTGLPDRYDGMTFDTYPVCDQTAGVVARLRALLDDTAEPSVLLYGPTGTGKTALAADFARTLVRRGKTLIFADVPELLATIRDTWDRDGTRDENDPRVDSERALMASLLDVDVLVLDDLGANEGRSWEVVRLFRILNGRYGRRKQTVVTTNYLPSELSLTLGDQGERQVWRLIEDGETLKLDGPNLRNRRLRKAVGVAS